MSTLHRRSIGVVVAVATLMALLPSMAAARSNVIVMTRNLYVGADLTPAIAASSPGQLVVAVADIHQAMVETDFPARAKLLAQEIADASPDLVGLQEVALWRSGPFNNPATATTVESDFLALLLAEIDGLGLDYTAAVIQENLDVEVPATVTSDPVPVPVFRDVRLTIRNVILVREGVSYTNPRSDHFETNVSFSNVGGIPGNSIIDLRGWTFVDFQQGNKQFRFVNTHLEPSNATIRDAQAQEFIADPLQTTLKVVAVGDFNSPPIGPDSGAYQILTKPSVGKMRDTWTQANPNDPGFTWGQAADLLNPTSTASIRIDLILTKTPAVKTVQATLLGTTARTPGGLWASDHFGVDAELSIP
jgi:endonuclease/exonuclease/phosphatase family metal-dependent hydrolase